MSDVFDAVTRSEIMRRVRSSHTRPEIKVEAALREAGIAYSSHPKAVTGSPDLVVEDGKVAVFVHGCFWHGHTCRRGARVPKANREYWQAKISRNRERDCWNLERLRNEGWRTQIIWECELVPGVLALQNLLAH
jgi:DNA mismatch endonuclease (patch repair protein)